MPRTAQRPSLPGTDEMTLVSLFMRLFHTLIDDEPFFIYTFYESCAPIRVYFQSNPFRSPSWPAGGPLAVVIKKLG